jgi:putative sigma-54 modulation protein
MLKLRDSYNLMIIKNKKIAIQSTNFKSSRKLSSFVRKQISKLELMSERIVEIRVSLKLDATVESNKICEITVLMPGKDLFVSKKSESFEESVSTSVDALRHQLEHWKTSISGRDKNFRKAIDT